MPCADPRMRRIAVCAVKTTVRCAAPNARNAGWRLIQRATPWYRVLNEVAPAGSWVVSWGWAIHASDPGSAGHARGVPVAAGVRGAYEGTGAAPRALVL